MTLLRPGAQAPDVLGQPTRLVSIRSAGVAVIAIVNPDGLPRIVHWGREVEGVEHLDVSTVVVALEGQVSHSALDEPWPLTTMPTERDGWAGRPALAGHRAREPLFPGWRVDGFTSSEDRFGFVAEGGEMRLVSSFVLDTAGVLHVDHTVTNLGDNDVELAIVETTMPLDSAAQEVLDLTGRWSRERSPQRRPLNRGSFARESRRGRTGHDSPTLLAAGSRGFDDSSGQLWGVHLAWSGDSVYRVDDLPEGQSAIGVGELLRPGEIVLSPKQDFRAPTALFVWSDAGLDGLSQRMHASIRSRPSHRTNARPVILNTWEAVYFDHDLEKLSRLADVAASIGVERFVLDDGWFLGRRTDSAGLGDWTVDPSVWPDGLRPLVDHVRDAGMEFGLWVEPEMINLDSELARLHPDWILEARPALGREWRGQHVLDLARTEVVSYLFAALNALIVEYEVAYLKWDHNRDLLEAVHNSTAGVDAHTRGAYALLDQLRDAHPDLEIESCASGGARVDLGILERTDRVWASDTNDPVERTSIQRWTEFLLPPELIGSHVGPTRAHTTGRSSDLDFQLATSLLSWPGIERDITECSEDELDALRNWIILYKRIRDLIRSGTVTHSAPDDGSLLTGIVAQDSQRAIYRLSRTATSDNAIPPAIRFPGLRADAMYSVTLPPELRPPRMLDRKAPQWLASPPDQLSGGFLATIGLQAPLLAPGQALVVEILAI